VIFTQRLGLAELLSAPYTFANARVAGLYGVHAQQTDEDAFVRIELDPRERAGLLTQLGFLTAHDEGTTPNTIMRGVAVARHVLCKTLPPPPPNIPPLPELAPDATNRDRVEALTEAAPCSACHTHIINPLGYAFENIDGVGRFRTEENGQPIDAMGTAMIDGEASSFTGPVEFAQRIATSREAHECYARHWVEYLYGREVASTVAADRYLVEQAGAISRNVSSVENLLVELVATDAFMTRASSP
jgi:hypothetical protein